MFRDDNLVQRLPVHYEQSVWPVFTRDLPSPRAVPTEAAAIRPFRAEEATPDVPAAIGGMLFAAYFALIGALAIATAGPGESRMVLTIAGLFVVAFFAVPHFILAQEPKEGRRPALGRFLATGMRTLTGHCSGRAALVQMFIVPVALTLGILAIGLVIGFAG